MVDRDFIVTAVNSATKKLLNDNADAFRSIWPGFDPQKIVGTCIDVFHKNPAHQRQLLSDPARLPYFTHIHVGDLTISLNVGAIYDTDGSYIGNTLEWADVTRQLQTERDLNGVTQALDGTQAKIEFTLEGKIVDANRLFLDTVGYELDEIVGRHHSMFMDPRDAATPEYKEFWRNLARGEAQSGKFKRISKAREDVWIQGSYSPILDEDGKPYKVIKFAVDITEMEKEINEVRAKVTAINRSQAVIEFELDGTILTANDAFLSVMGYSRDEIVGKHHRMFACPDFAKSPEYQHHWDRLRNGEFIEGKFERVAKNGDAVWIQASYNPLFDLDGNPYKVIKFASDVTQIELERKRNEEERARKAAEQATVVSALASGLQSLSEGDLTSQIQQAFAEEYEQLRLDFNAAVTKLSDAMRGVVLNADGIRTSAGEISQAADDLSRRTEGQAATLEETAASLEELTASVKGAAEGADKANRVVSEAKRNAEESGEVVREAVAAMSEIEKSSEQISQIISVIDDIAFQTNLLALNAGVEAARAGDAGRGFAVVASEVRALAQRSSDAAKEIKTLISTSSQHVGRGVDLVGQAGKALHEIVDSVTNINDLVSTIATSAKEQSTGIGEINVAVNQLDQVTQQNAAMVEESTAASHSMAQEAEELARMVAAFKTDAAVSSVTGEVHKPARPQQNAKQSVAAQRERAAQFATQQATALKVNGSGGGDDNWEDF
ncbi:MAG: chemotaxis protein [Parvularcula sp.]|nr:chemotaxis protein [Parvularcula sp.]